MRGNRVPLFAIGLSIGNELAQQFNLLMRLDAKEYVEFTPLVTRNQNKLQNMNTVSFTSGVHLCVCLALSTVDSSDRLLA
jgi:hypothetical protein